jgi:hypothetical protein
MTAKADKAILAELLDLDNQKVVEERLLPRRDGKQEKSLFSINSSK